MGALVFWLLVVAILIGTTLYSRQRRLRRIERYAASGELRGMNIDGHERSNGAVAEGTAWTQVQLHQGGW